VGDGAGSGTAVWWCVRVKIKAAMSGVGRRGGVRVRRFLHEEAIVMKLKDENPNRLKAK